HTTVGGGFSNVAGQQYATVAGGYDNWTVGSHSVVSGGFRNYVGGNYSVISGGYADTVDVGAHYSYLFGIRSKLTQDSTFMVDMPHIWFGKETGGYDIPHTDGTSGQVLATNGAGQATWTTIAGGGGDIAAVNAGNGIKGGG